MELYATINQLKYKLEDKELRIWAIKYGMVDLAYKIDSCREIYLGNKLIDRRKLSENDKSIIQKVIDWIKQ